MSLNRSKSVMVLLFSLAVGGFVIIASQGFPRAQDSQGFGQGPGFYPQVLAWSLILLGISSFIIEFKAGPPPESSGAGSSRAEDPRHPRYGLMAAVLALCMVDVFIIQYLGFFVGGAVLIMGVMLMVKPVRDPGQLLRYALYTSAMVLMIYLVFELFIKIQLPRGTLFE